jgi:glycosyltransferase involved in cell wall biosynthesis
MRVLHLYAGNLYGGVERVLASLAHFRSLAPSMEPGFALCFEGRLSQELRDCGATVHMLGAVRFSRPWTVLSARRRLKQFLIRERFDVAVSHSPWTHAAFAPVVRDARLPLVFFSHGVPNARHWSGRAARRCPPALVLANSEFTSDATQPLFPQSPRRVFHLPIPQPLPNQNRDRAWARSETGTSMDATVIIMFSRIERLKGHDVLLKALVPLSDRSDWECWIVGGAQRPEQVKYMQELRELARTSRIEQRVKFLGERNDVPDLLASADIHCQPNTGPEGFGVAFIEAMYAGLPVVTSAIGGAMEIVRDSQTGRLLPAGDVAGLVEALTELIVSPEKRAEMGQAGMRRAQELCTPDRQIPGLADLLASVALTNPSEVISGGANR